MKHYIAKKTILLIIHSYIFLFLIDTLYGLSLEKTDYKELIFSMCALMTTYLICISIYLIFAPENHYKVIFDNLLKFIIVIITFFMMIFISGFFVKLISSIYAIPLLILVVVLFMIGWNKLLETIKV